MVGAIQWGGTGNLVWTAHVTKKGNVSCTLSINLDASSATRFSALALVSLILSCVTATQVVAQGCHSTPDTQALIHQKAKTTATRFYFMVCI
eukprot:5166486-Amphidinium_carterae.1